MNKVSQKDSLISNLNLSKVKNNLIDKKMINLPLAKNHSRDESYLRNLFKTKSPQVKNKVSYFLVSDMNLSFVKDYIKIKKLEPSSLRSILMLKKMCKQVSSEIREKISKD